MSTTITLNPLAGALRDVLQKHEREVAARVRLANANASSSAVRDVVVPAAEQELSTAGIALQAAILEYTDQVLDLIDASRELRTQRARDAQLAAAPLRTRTTEFEAIPVERAPR